MTTKKNTPPAKKTATKVIAGPAKHRAESPPSTSATQKHQTTHRASPIAGQGLPHDRGNDPSDLVRDQRLRKDLEKDGGRSPGDRHRERLTGIEAEEDGVRNDDDEIQRNSANTDP